MTAAAALVLPSCIADELAVEAMLWLTDAAAAVGAFGVEAIPTDSLLLGPPLRHSAANRLGLMLAASTVLGLAQTLQVPACVCFGGGVEVVWGVCACMRACV